jgi:hypothetical protein
VKTGHPWLHSHSHDPRSTGSLDPKKSSTRMTRGRVGRTPLIHLLADKAFNATTSTNMATTPPAWEQHPYLILLFTAHPGMGAKKLSLFTPRRSLFYHRRPLDAQDDNHNAGVFWDLVLSVPRWPPQSRPDQASSAVSQIEEQRPYGRHSQMHVATTTSTTPTAPSPLRHRLRVFRTPRPLLDSIKEKANGS